MDVGSTAFAPPVDGSPMSAERVPVTVVGGRERRIRDPSDGSVDTLRLVTVRYADGREREWLDRNVKAERD